MKFVTFEVQTPFGPIQRVGVLRNQEIIDLNAVYSAFLREGQGVYRWKEMAQSLVPPDMLSLIEGGEMSRDACNTALEYFDREGSSLANQNREKYLYRLNDVKLKAPIPRPVSIRDCSAFLDHIKHAHERHDDQMPSVFFEIPAYYRTSTTDVIGDGEDILWPSYSELLDYELEYAICIGKTGVNIPVEKAEEYIFGYTIFNDISARDTQRKEMQLRMGPAKGKCFQNSNIMGPCLVTPDELNPYNLKMLTRVNGELWSEGNSNTMTFKFPQIIHYLSKDEPVYPGEIIASGTVGFGCGSELNKWIKPGDTIEMEVEGIGILKNKVVRQK